MESASEDRNGISTTATTFFFWEENIFSESLGKKLKRNPRHRTGQAKRLNIVPVFSRGTF